MTTPELEAWVRNWFADRYQAGDVFDDGAEALTLDAALRLVADAQAAERERCAKVADEHARRDYPWGSENADLYHAQADWAAKIAEAIRQQKD